MNKNKLLFYVNKNKFLHVVSFRWLLVFLVICCISIGQIVLNNKSNINNFVKLLSFVSNSHSKSEIYKFYFKYFYTFSFICTFVVLFVSKLFTTLSKELLVVLQVKQIPNSIKNFFTSFVICTMLNLLLLKIFKLSVYEIIKVQVFMTLIIYLRFLILTINIKFYSKLFVIGEFLIFGFSINKIGSNSDLWVISYIGVVSLILFVYYIKQNKMIENQRQLFSPKNMFSMFIVTYIRQNKYLLVVFIIMLFPLSLQSNVNKFLSNLLLKNYNIGFDVWTWLLLNLVAYYLMFIVIMKSRISISDGDKIYFKHKYFSILCVINFVFTFQLSLITVFNVVNKLPLNIICIYFVVYLLMQVWFFLKVYININSVMFAICNIVISSFVLAKVEKISLNAHLYYPYVIAFICALLAVSIAGLIVSYKRSTRCLD